MAVDPKADAASFDSTALEEALADFLDWCDRSRAEALPRDVDSQDPDKLVAAFLQDHAQWRDDRRLSQQLADCVHQLAPIERAAADVTLQWLQIGTPLVSAEGTDFSVNDGSLPCMFAGYELLECVGHGGMGVVYKARQPRLGRVVCLKMLPPGLVEPDRVRRLADEARLAGTLQHPGIVAVFDAGENDGRPYYVMEFIRGETLGQRLARERPSAQDAAGLLDQIAAAVQHAHQHGVLHRDLKPANVLLDAADRPRITDFGLARRLDVSASASGIAGTPSYMAPEQARGADVDARTDVYGLGGILYEMLTGRPPHVGDSPWKTLRLVESAEPPAPRQLRPGLSRDLETICLKCLQKQPAARYATVTDLRDDLGRFRRGEPILARPVGAIGRAVRWAWRRPAAAFAAVVSIAAIIFGAIALVQTRASLEVTKNSEQRQRVFVVRLARENERAEEALYRSRIARVAQLLDANDVAAARNLLQAIESNPARNDRQHFELNWLRKRAWPEAVLLKDSGDRVIDGAWLPHGEALATISADGELCTWDGRGNPLRAAKHARAFTVLAASLSQIATADAQGVVQLWNAQTLRLESPLRTGGPTIRQLCWLDDDLLLAVDGPGTMRIIATHQQVWRNLPLAPGRVMKVSLSAQADWLAVAWDERHIGLFDVNSLRATMTAPTGGGEAAGQNSGGQSLDQQTLHPRAMLAATSWILDLAWSPAANRLAAVDETGALMVWDVTINEASGPVVEERWKSAATSGAVSSIAWQERTLLVAGENGGVTAFDTERLHTLWRQPSLPIERLAAENVSGRWAAIDGRNHRAALWIESELSAGQPIWTQAAPIRTVALNGTGRFLAWRDVDGAVVVRDVHDGREVLRTQESVLGATALCWNPIRNELAVGRHNETVLYRVEEGKQTARWTHPGAVWSLAFSPDGRYLASGAAGTATIADLAGGASLLPLDGHEGDIRAIAFSSDSRLLATIDGNSDLRIWEAPSRRLLVEQRLDANAVHALCFFDRHLLLAAGDSGRITRIALREDDGIATMTSWEAHRGPLWSLLTVGDRILSCGQDGKIQVWDREGELLTTVAHHSAAIWSLTCHVSTGRLLASTTAGSIHAWR